MLLFIIIIIIQLLSVDLHGHDSVLFYIYYFRVVPIYLFSFLCKIIHASASIHICVSPLSVSLSPRIGWGAGVQDSGQDSGQGREMSDKTNVDALTSAFGNSMSLDGGEQDGEPSPDTPTDNFLDQLNNLQAPRQRLELFYY